MLEARLGAARKFLELELARKMMRVRGKFGEITVAQPHKSPKFRDARER